MNAPKEKALTPYQSTVGATMTRIGEMQDGNQIQFPADYSPQNALQAAWLILQETVDRERKPVLEACTKTSIANSLLDMVVSGLNPAKKQGYFIAYGKQLSFQRSYFGSMALAKRVDPTILDIVAEVIFEGDEFEYEIVRGVRQIVKHRQTLGSIDSGKVKGAYCMIIGQEGVVQKTEIMTMKEIKKSWSKSKMKPVETNGDIKKGSTHADYLVEMCKKTIINRTCKPIINSSSDKALLSAVNRSEFTASEQAAQTRIEENANKGEVVDLEPPPAEDHPDNIARRAEEARNANDEQAQTVEERKENGQPIIFEPQF